MEDRIRRHAIIQGRVQGVFFRMETKQEAQAHGVTGWVRNLPDGAVEAVFEGEKDKVETVLAWCRQGPSAARVDSVDITEEPCTGEFAAFSITR